MGKLKFFYCLIKLQLRLSSENINEMEATEPKIMRLGDSPIAGRSRDSRSSSTSSSSCSSSTSSAATTRALPVHIVEDHNDALPWIYRAIGRKLIPLKNNVMIHFDSHPDLGIPKDLKAENVFDKHALFSEISIENWILPAVFAGHIRHVVWGMPPWCDQMPPDVDVTCHVGRSRVDGGIRIDLALPYFLEEGLWAPKADLEDVKIFRLQTIMVGRSAVADSSHSKDSEKDLERILKELSSLSSTLCSSSSSSSATSSVLLDVDLDFFSTLNPFKVMLSPRQFELLQKVYFFQFPVSKAALEETVARSTLERRRKQVNVLERFFLSLPSNLEELDIDKIDFPVIASLENPINKSEKSANSDIDVDSLKLLIEDIIKHFPDGLRKKKNPSNDDWEESENHPGGESESTDLCSNGPKSSVELISTEFPSPIEVDWEILHWGGLTCDSTPLPHHVSDEAEIDRLVLVFSQFLEKIFSSERPEIRHSPSLITIARSSNDDYCPPEAVDEIQRKTVSALEALFKKNRDLHIQKHYLEDA